MYDGTEIRRIFTRHESANSAWRRLLKQCGLEAEHGNYTVGLFDEDDRLLACATLAGNVIRGVAVDESARNTSLTNRLVSDILSHARNEGYDNVFVFTKPEYRGTFESLSFHYVGGTDLAIMLENNGQALEYYKEYLEDMRSDGYNGAIVMRCNPLTRGHLYLIEKAREGVDTLYIIPVADDTGAEYSYEERRTMLRRAVQGMPNVVVLEGSSYVVSSATFPTYFFKSATLAAEAHILLDLDIFCRHIVPPLGIQRRYVGTEPDDALTARYNEMMREVLPAHGISTVIYDRLRDADGRAISAARVRVAVDDYRAGDAIDMLPQASISFVLAHTAAKAMTDELLLTPKPGLVDTEDSGAHSDMDAVLMTRSIAALVPAFEHAATLADIDATPTDDDLAQIGRHGEERMMKATGGVNTHRGALFALGVTTTAAARLIRRHGTVSTDALRREIVMTAGVLPRPVGTHGEQMHERYGVKTALDMAQGGYDSLFDSWLPFYKDALSQGDTATARKRLLLKIMSEIDDTNVYYRCGQETAHKVKAIARQALNGCTDDDLRQMNARFKEHGISPGGSADMLALTLYIYSITNRTK